MCHQCQRNDKGRVVRCTKCKRKRFCVFCINNWYVSIYVSTTSSFTNVQIINILFLLLRYPHLKEDQIAEACPVCCGNCNCKGCLSSRKLIDVCTLTSSTPFTYIFSIHSTFLILLSYTLQSIKQKKDDDTNNDHQVEVSKYMLKALLPHLIRLDQQQMVEKEIEAKIQGILYTPFFLFNYLHTITNSHHALHHFSRMCFFMIDHF